MTPGDARIGSGTCGANGGAASCHRQQRTGRLAGRQLAVREQFAPGEHLVGVDVVLAGDTRNGRVRQQRLGDDGQLELVAVAPIAATGRGALGWLNYCVHN